MKITIDSVIRLQNVPEEILKQIKAELTMRNPDYDKKRRMGLDRWLWGPEYIKLYSEKAVNGSSEYILPRGYFQRLWNLAGLNWDAIDDRRIKLPEIEFPTRPQLRDYQDPAIKQARDWQQGVVIMPCGAGKGHPLDTKIYTPKGVTTFGELHVGDKVFGSNGKTCTVTGVYDRGVLPTYRVTFSDDTSILCDGDHIWTVQRQWERTECPGRWNNMTVTELLNSKMFCGTDESQNRSRWYIPVVNPVEFEQKEVPIDPWILGVYLGDGHCKGSVMISNSEADKIGRAHV